MERQSGGIHQTAGLREGPRSAIVHVVADHFGVATPLDQDALHCMLTVVCGLLGWNLQTVASRGAGTGGEPPSLAEVLGQDPALVSWW